MKTRTLLLVLAVGFGVSAAAAVASNDQKLAERILITAGDLPNGWKASSLKNDDADKCLKGSLDDEAYPLATAQSRGFYDGDLGYAASLGAVYKGSGAAVAALNGIAADKVTKCLRSNYKRVEAAGLKIIGASSANIEAFPNFGDHTRAIRVTIRVHASKQNVNASFYGDVVMIQRGRALAVILLEDFPKPPSPKLEGRISLAVAARMKR